MKKIIAAAAIGSLLFLPACGIASKSTPSAKKETVQKVDPNQEKGKSIFTYYLDFFITSTNPKEEILSYKIDNVKMKSSVPDLYTFDVTYDVKPIQSDSSWNTMGKVQNGWSKNITSKVTIENGEILQVKPAVDGIQLSSLNETNGERLSGGVALHDFSFYLDSFKNSSEANKKIESYLLQSVEVKKKLADGFVAEVVFDLKVDSPDSTWKDTGGNVVIQSDGTWIKNKVSFITIKNGEISKVSSSM